MTMRNESWYTVITEMMEQLSSWQWIQTKHEGPRRLYGDILSIFLYFDKFHSSLSFTEAMIQTYPNQVHHFIIKKATFLNENFLPPMFHCFAWLFSGFVLHFKLKSLHSIWYPITWCLSLGSVESDFKLNLKYPDCTTVLLMYHCKD